MKLIKIITIALLPLASFAKEPTLGQQVYNSNCAVCHQNDAQGAVGLAPPLKASYWSKLVSARSYVPGVLLLGMHGSLSTDEGVFVGVMPPQNRLSDGEIAAVTNHLFSVVNGQASWEPLQADEVAKLRTSSISVAQLRSGRKQALSK